MVASFIFAAVVIGIVVFLIYLKINLKICEPNEILVFSGRKRRLKTGEIVGYRIIRGGRALKAPIIETVSRLSLATIPIEIEMDGALSGGMIPLNVKAIAHVKIASREEDGLENAVERLLGKPSHEIQTIAKTTIEGILRGVLATLTPEEANYNRMEFEKKVFELAKQELKNTGFTLDSVKIEDIKDTYGYLEAVGRQRNAVVKRDARIKEAEAEAEAKIVEAESRRKAADSEFVSDTAIVEYETNFRNKKAQLNEQTYRQEVRAEYTKKIEEMHQQDKLEEIRIDMHNKKYNAEVVIPAEAERKADELKAIGKASLLKEQGLAMAEAVKKMRSEWEKGDTKELFMIHILPNIVESVSKVIADNLRVEKLVIMGNGGIPKHVGDVTGSVISFLEQIKSVTGIDLTKLFEEKKSSPLKKELA